MLKGLVPRGGEPLETLVGVTIVFDFRCSNVSFGHVEGGILSPFSGGTDDKLQIRGMRNPQLAAGIAELLAVMHGCREHLVREESDFVVYHFEERFIGD